METGKKFNFKDFEVMTETSNGQLVGGFSITVDTSFTAPIGQPTNSNCPIINNCDGGNCAKGCGNG